MGRLPEAWIAPAEIRELRELTRYRHKLVGLRTSCRDQVHAVLAKLGVPVTHSDIFGGRGQAWLDGLRLPQPYAGKVASLRQLTAELTGEIALLEQVIGDLLAGHEGYRAIQQLPGIGPVPVAVIVAEIGDIRRFPGPGQLCSWAGLTPRHRESDTKVSRGHVTKQGPRMLRWAVCEAIQRQPAGTRPRQVKDGIIARRGTQARNTAKPPPANCSPWSSTACATGAPAAPAARDRPHDLDRARGRARGRATYCPPPGTGTRRAGSAGARVIDPARPAA